MPSSPVDPKRSTPAQAAGYQTSWDAIMRMTREGASWSGFERNSAFLNTGGERFADVSHVSGLGFIDDGRAVAVTDWDGDGAADLVLRNRTGPRLRLMRNATGRGENAVTLELVGTTGNRDAVGARVTLVPGSGKPVTATLSAGSGFLSQSSKRLVLGTGGAGVTSLEVRWPDGTREAFEGVKRGGRYRLVESSGRTETIAARAQPQLAVKAIASLEPTGSAATVLPAPIPFPTCRFDDGTGELAELARPAKPLLLLLWSRNCEVCGTELASLTADAERLQTAGLDVLALAVDAAAGRDASELAAAATHLQDLDFPYPSGSITPESLTSIAGWQAALFDYPPPDAVPLAFLLDPAGRAVAIYRGELDLELIAADLRFVGAGADALRDASVPLPGRWFTTSPKGEDMPEWLWKNLDERYLDEALRFLEMAVKASGRSTLRTELAAGHHRHARALAKRSNFEPALAHFERALVANPQSPEILNDYGALLAYLGRGEDAAKAYRRALEIRPDFGLARENLQRLETQAEP